MSPSVVIVGAGGHARVVADALLAAGMQVLGCTDADPRRHGGAVLGLPVLGDDSALASYDRSKVLLANGVGGVGDRTHVRARRNVQQRLIQGGWQFATIVHPRAIVSAHARLGAGVQVLAGAVVQVGASVGDGCIINTGAIVEHDVVLGDFTHVAPRGLVCGDVTIGPDCHIGAGAIVRQGLRLGADTLVGAGAVVVKDFAEACVLVGVPARVLERPR